MVDTSMYRNIEAPKIMGPGEVLSLQNVAQQGQLQRVQLEEAQRAQQDKNALRGVLQGGTDPNTGLPTPETIAKVSQIDPKLGGDLTRQMVQLQDLNIARMEKKRTIANRVGSSYVESYDRYLQQTGGNVEQAKMLAQQDAQGVIDELDRSGIFSANGLKADDVAKLRQLPEPEKARTLVIGMGGTIKEIPHAQSPLGKLEADYRAGRISKKDYEETKKKLEAPSQTMIRLEMDKAGDYSKTGDDFLKTIPVEHRGMVKKVANYEMDPKTFSTLGGQRERYLNWAAQYDPNFDQKEYNSRFQAVNKFNTGPQGNTVRSLGVAIEHMDTARQMALELKNGSTPAFNKIAQEFAKQTGRPAPTNFDSVKDIVADEVVKGVLGGSGALEDRKVMAENIRKSASPEQLAGVFDSWTKLLGGQVEGLKTQYETSTGRKDFESKLTPRAREALRAVSGGGDVKSKVEAAGWSYEPDKYEYRVEGGKVQRRKK